jgi:hypothetical protein
MVRPGRENGTPTEPENVDRGRWLANTPVTTKDERDYFVAAGPCYCLRCPGTEGKITECLIVVSQGWGSPHDLRDSEKRDDDRPAVNKKEDKELLSIGEIRKDSFIQRCRFPGR